ncbi:DNA polymerase I [Feifania hominis]|uniref:DNA polymerase I n=1 Tax=Feifania hominis TaxID=2763660 RepID=A0A926DG80_9FIRM|nr:DNA polymerase I [Feifania hominis]MBC8536475.1 DNA polymerase I [Feifania hominis]
MKLLVFDGNSIINRAFYGIRLLSTSDGVFTNAVYGFLNILEKELTAEAPDAVCVAFDLAGPTFRHEQFAEYKAGRRGMPDELASQLPVLKQVLDAMHIARLELQGYEADDIIGTIAARCESAGDDCVIVTGDKDDLQLIGPHVAVKLAVTAMGRSETTRYDRDKFVEVYGFEPRRMIDFKALQGDASDNIPGVPGIGEKTAKALLQDGRTLEDIYADLDALPVKPGAKKKLAEGRESAFLSYQLATIDCHVPLELDFEAMRRRDPDFEALLALYEKLEFKSFADRLRERRPEAAPPAFEAPPVQKLTGEAEVRALLAPGGTLCLDYDPESVLVLTGGALFELNRFECMAGFDECIRLLFESPNEKVMAAGKHARTALAAEGIELRNLVFDAELAGYVLNPSANSYTPATLALGYLTLSIGEGRAEALAVLPLLRPELLRRMGESGEDRLYFDIELPLSAVLSAMEREGFAVDTAALHAYGQELTGRIAELTQEIFAISGYEFNINSTKQLGEVLFERLGLPVVKKTKTGYSTDADVLEKLRPAHEIVDLVLRYRQLQKLKSTYVDGLLKLTDPHTGRVHTTFRQTVTQTGRISSTEPNLQNIPVREEEGRRLRRMFVAREGCTLVDADYSQIELRVLAHISGDETMLEAFNQNEDIHTVTASQVFGVERSAVTPLMRRRAKAVNFGIVYGISDFSLSQDIGVSRREAREYIDQYFATYPKIKAYLDRTVEQAKADGYVTTLFGRRRYLPELKSGNYNMRMFGERVAMNTPIQGTAADIIKIAMVRVYNRLRAEGLRSRLILQVHDELIIETERDELARVRALLKEEMEGAASLSVVLRADVSEGESWYDAK